MIDKYIQELQTLENQTINSKYDLQPWQVKAVNIVARVYGENSKQEEQIKEINFESYPVTGIYIGGKFSGGGGGNNGRQCEKQVQEIIKSFIKDLKTFGTPEPKKHEKSDRINISVNQSQNQTLNVNVIWESIKGELTGKQLKEFEEIISENNKPDLKKKKIFEKLKSFGTDVASNIIAGILTNPAVYGG